MRVAPNVMNRRGLCMFYWHKTCPLLTATNLLIIMYTVWGVPRLNSLWRWTVVHQISDCSTVQCWVSAVYPSTVNQELQSQTARGRKLRAMDVAQLGIGTGKCVTIVFPDCCWCCHNRFKDVMTFFRTSWLLMKVGSTITEHGMA
jgi:hypothetical protein